MGDPHLLQVFGVFMISVLAVWTLWRVKVISTGGLSASKTDIVAAPFACIALTTYAYGLCNSPL